MTTSSLIDHITTNTPEKNSLSGVIHTGISDHSLVFAIRNRLESNKVPWITSEIKNLINSFSSGRKVAILSCVVLNAYIFQTIHRT
jgi:hypothetical protein